MNNISMNNFNNNMNINMNNFNNMNNMNFNQMFNNLQLLNQLSNQFNNLSQNNLNNMNNNNNNKNDNKQNQKKPVLPGKSYFITFTLEVQNKQIFIDANENENFFDVAKELDEKYKWLNTFGTKRYFFKNKEITENKPINKLGIKDNSNIIIKT